MRGLWGVVALVIFIVGVSAVALIAALGSSGTAVAELELGDCFDLPAPSSDATDQSVEIVERVDLIDCDKAHHAQVVLVGELNSNGDLEYPTDVDLFDAVDLRCAATASLVGDQFGLLPVAPTENSWDRVSGRFHCLAVQFGGASWTGTLLPPGPSG